MDTITPEILKQAVDLLNLYQIQYTQTDRIWNYFATVTLALLAFSVGNEKATRSFREASVLILGYLVFCIGNSKSLFKAHDQLVEFARHAVDAASKASIPFQHLSPLPTDEVRPFYWLVVLTVCIGIGLISYWRQTKTGENDRKERSGDEY